jgi:hypothetical protein
MITLKGGGRAIFKSSAKEADNLTAAKIAGIESGSFWRREVATYRLAQIIGFGDLVPPTTARKIGNDVGSIQEFVKGRDAAEFLDENGHSRPDKSEFDGQEDAARAALFDFITGQMDRHYGNWRINSEGKIALTDNGLSFPTKGGPLVMSYAPDYFANHVHTDPVPDVSGLKAKEDQIRSELTPLIGPEAVDLTIKRIGMASSKSVKLIGDLSHEEAPIVHRQPPKVEPAGERTEQSSLRGG